jgi:hypothetical protein
MEKEEEEKEEEEGRGRVCSLVRPFKHQAHYRGKAYIPAIGRGLQGSK